MEFADARQAVIEIDAEMKKLWPDAWAMFVVTERGHIQLALLRRGHHPYFTFDIPADDPEWFAKFDQGVHEMRQTLDALKSVKESET